MCSRLTRTKRKMTRTKSDRVGPSGTEWDRVGPSVVLEAKRCDLQSSHQKSYTSWCEQKSVNVTFAVKRHHKSEHTWQAIVSRSYLPESEHPYVS